MAVASEHGKWYWLSRGFVNGLLVAWLLEILLTDGGIGPLSHYVAPFVIAGLIVIGSHDAWLGLKAIRAKKSN